MLLKEYGWYGMVCPHCKVGLLPEPDDPQNDTTSECIDCRKQTDVKSLLEVSLCIVITYHLLLGASYF